MRFSLSVALAATLWSADTGYNLFQKGLAKERAESDPRAAIKIYEQVVHHHATDRKLAAQALIRLAECYEKLGDSGSRKAYEQILRDYPDQKDAAAMARTRLGEDVRRRENGTTFRQLWKLPRNGTVGGAITRDGRFLAFVDWAKNGNLFLHDFLTGADRALTDTATDQLPEPKIEQFASETGFSRDSKHLAYSWFRGDRNRFELRLIELKGDAIPSSRLLFDDPDVHWIAPLDWSPDGKSIAVTLIRADKSGQIGLLSIPDGKLRVLKTVEWRGTTALFFSPDGKYLAYDIPVGSNVEQRDVFVIAADGSSETPAVVSPSQDTVIGWSNDGRHLLFASDRSGSVGVWSVPINDGNVVGQPELLKSDVGQISTLGLSESGKLYSSVSNSGSNIYVSSIDFPTGKLLSPPTLASQSYVGSNLLPAWSNDGKYLAYASSRGAVGVNYFVIVIRNLGTGEVREISPAPILELLQNLQWAPDGLSLLAKARDPKGRYGIFRVDAHSGRSSILVTQDERETIGLVGISPDGKKLYYLSRGWKESIPRPQKSLFRSIERDLATGDDKLLHTSDKPTVSRLSPDGRYLFITAPPPSNQRFAILPVAGGDLRQLSPGTTLASIRGAEWAPDSTAIYVMTGPTTFLCLPIDGSQSRTVEVNWNSSYPQMGPVRLHPDGRRVAFHSGPLRNPTEVWVLEHFLPPTTSAARR